MGVGGPVAMEHEEAPAALAAVGASSCLDLFAFDSGVNGNNYVGGQSIGGRMFADGRASCRQTIPVKRSLPYGQAGNRTHSAA